jgi:hypothetical protein
MSEEIPPELLAELEALDAPAPNAHYLRLENGRLRSDLPVEIATFLSRAATMLDQVLATATPAPVYGDELLASERIGDLIELDAHLRRQIGGDFTALDRLLSSTDAPTEDLPALMRAVNRLRLAFSGKHDEIATTGKILCNVLLADLLELHSFL